MRLPCQHIFKVRNIVELPLFEPELVKERWTMNYYEQLADAGFSSNEDTCFGTPPASTTVKERGKTVLTQAQKFRKALKTAQCLASLASEGGMVTFRSRMRVLEDIVENWQLGRDVRISISAKDMTHGNQKSKTKEEQHQEKDNKSQEKGNTDDGMKGQEQTEVKVSAKRKDPYSEETMAEIMPKNDTKKGENYKTNEEERKKRTTRKARRQERTGKAVQKEREEKTEEQKEKEITNEDFKKRRSKRETRMEAVEEGKRMTVEQVTKKESETGEILKTEWLKMQSETLNEEIENESEKTSDS